ncbi:MAG: transcriptional regulator [Desulfamplus sp.]|nr:transcriptional regulator [Desulfamplus sp.]MBF0413111.1 transcriptional regulator [Desulfamplus sp.]
MANKIVIKKYPNRRLYNTDQSTYITLEDVGALIKKGFRVEVTDVNTGDDVTSVVLTQIIMNKAKDANGLLPVSLLHLIIQFGENLLHEFFEKYLERTIENYLDYRKRMDDQISAYNAYLEMGMDFSRLDFSGFAGKAFKDIEPMKFFAGVKENSNDKKESADDKDE